MDIGWSKTSHAKLVAYNGIRELRLKCDEFQKQQIPHLNNFKSGQSMLVTVAGRPPYCLRCSRVGHIRSRCPERRTFSQAVQGVHADPVAPPEISESSVASSAEPVCSKDAPMPSRGTGNPDSYVRGWDDEQQTSESQTEQENGSMELEQEKGLKRGQNPVTDSFVTPNRSVRPRVQPPGTPVSLSNSFSVINALLDGSPA